MNMFRQHPHSAQREQVHKDWIDERLREARIVVADVVSHSDHLLRLACKVLVQHGETPTEREDARILLVVLDARSPVRTRRQRPDPEDAR
jgi:hypothetical protein